MQKHDVPLLIHGEVTDGDIDTFDREAVFIERVMKPLRQAFPALRVVFEHITTKEAVDYVRDAEGPIAATITPQHLLYNRNALFTGGIRPHWYCLPILKREVHRQALVEAATSESTRFFLGTDSAPHAQHLKEMSCGCAGCYSAHTALEFYAMVFDQAGRLDRLEAFASHRGPDFLWLAKKQNHGNAQTPTVRSARPIAVRFFDLGTASSRRDVTLAIGALTLVSQSLDCLLSSSCHRAYRACSCSFTSSILACT